MAGRALPLNCTTCQRAQRGTVPPHYGWQFTAEFGTGRHGLTAPFGSVAGTRPLPEEGTQHLAHAPGAEMHGAQRQSTETETWQKLVT